MFGINGIIFGQIFLMNKISSKYPNNPINPKNPS
jgi:hypothetical protein